MKKRTKKYHPKPKSAPLVVIRNEINTEIEAKELSILTLFKYGHATKDTYNDLIQMINVMFIGATLSNDKTTSEYCKAKLFPIGKSILDRFERTKKFGLSADEYKTLCKFMTAYKSYWNTKSAVLFKESVDQFYLFQESVREAA